MGSLKEIAKKAGLNVSTVSRYLSGELKVKKETEDRILSVIHELGYQPNAVAKALRTKVSKTIGVIIPTLRNPLFADMTGGVDSVLRQNGYSILLSTTENNPRQEYENFLMLCSKQVDGIILIGSSFIHEEQFDKYLHQNVPLVCVNRFGDQQKCVSIQTDFYSGSCQAAEYLIQKGKKRIGYILGSWEDEESKVKYRGYRDTLEKYGLDITDELQVEGFYNYEKAMTVAEKLLSCRPDAVMAANDLMAIAVLKTAHHKKIRIPEELALIGYGNSEASNFTIPSLSTIDQQKWLTGQQSANKMLKLLNNEPLDQIIIETQLIVRSSS